MHRDSKVSIRYAKSLLDFAEEQKSLSAVAADMELIAKTCEESKDLLIMLKSPIIQTAKKVSALQAVFAGKVGTIAIKFITILVKKNREVLLPEISRSFGTLYKAHQGIMGAEITTAVPLDEEGRKKAMAFIHKLSDKVELTEKVDKNIIGGFIIRVKDKQYDESVLSRINALKREFSKNPYIAQI
jgi:F-type H+-transporting ATPase subunit delta